MAVTTARALEPASDIPIAAADTFRACLWVAIGSCIRGHLLFLLGLPVVLAGFRTALTVVREMRAGRARARAEDEDGLFI